ncbi:unnamed protein product [Lactuca virosa]|uniref:F-box domain-containing protein n=1 Tax=Lactuca virosa TaxID=75947 RepID=A0AAU9LAV0_9ASTR|nr:unnamed protein product [Lactuca virosa]
MRNLKKSRDGVEADSSSITTLPDEILLQILNRLIDLKTLCFCYLVSRRFSSIVLQVDTISFTAPLINPPIPDKNTVGDVSPRVKSLFVELPTSSEIGIDNRCLFKWKVKFGNRIESFMFLWPNSISDQDGFYLNGNEDDEEDIELTCDLSRQKFRISCQCLEDVVVRHKMSLFFIKSLPTLEKVSITDSGRSGEFSLSGEKLNEVNEWLHSTLETVMNRVEVPARVNQCYIPVLKLPVSGGCSSMNQVMKQVEVTTNKGRENMSFECCSCYILVYEIAVDAISISFTAPLVNPPIHDKNTVDDAAPFPPKFSSYYEMKSLKAVEPDADKAMGRAEASRSLEPCVIIFTSRLHNRQTRQSKSWFQID